MRSRQEARQPLRGRLGQVFVQRNPQGDMGSSGTPESLSPDLQERIAMTAHHLSLMYQKKAWTTSAAESRPTIGTRSPMPEVLYFILRVLDALGRRFPYDFRQS
jgi:hypothetical protein